METGRAAPGGRSPPPPVPAGRHLRRAHRTLARQSGAPPKPTFRDRGPGGAAAVCDLGTVPCALSSLLCAPGHRRRRIVSHLPYRALVPFARSHSPFGQRWKVPRSPRREHQVPERNSHIMKRSAAEEASRGMGEGLWERITATKQKCVMEGDLVLQGLWGASGGCFSGAAVWRRLNKWGVLHGPLERAREAGHRERQRRESQHPRRSAGACEGSAPPERSRPPWRPAIVGGTRGGRAAPVRSGDFRRVSKLAEGLASLNSFEGRTGREQGWLSRPKPPSPQTP